MSTNLPQEKDEAMATDGAQQSAAAPAAQRKRKKWAIALATVAAIVVIAGSGFWIWHEQPSFCNAFCHIPMDAYNRTYDQAADQPGTDKFGNEVSNTNAMMAVSHRDLASTTCMGCHVPQLSEQVSEGIGWITSNYEVIATETGEFEPIERNLSDLVEARGIAPEAFCLNEACHTNQDGSVMTREDLIAATSDMTRNPHVQQHEDVSCDQCHKAHRASVNYCAACHADADLPDGWITPAEEMQLNKGLDVESA